MKKDELIKELETYKYDYDYFFERFKNSEKFSETIMELNSRIEKIHNIGVSFHDNEIITNLKSLTNEQLEEEKKLLDMIKKKKIIEDRIDKLSQPYKSVLLYKYISLYSFGEIAKKMNYSIKRIYQLHQKGIELYIKKCIEESVAPISTH